jgi:aminomethyltransferase
MAKTNQTVFHDRHLQLGARITDFGGWDMPLQYPSGIVEEHLATRKNAGLFDVSHMGRIVVRGTDALPFLQHVLTNNAAGLDVGVGQYTMIPNDRGGAVDDAYLYRFVTDEYLLVVNAANREKDWSFLDSLRKDFPRTEMQDRTHELAMLALQGPRSKQMLLDIVESGELPEPIRNALGIVTIGGAKVLVARTGYTGEPICFELFIDREDALTIWDLLTGQGAVPVGLGARDTLRLEAGLPLYGHELGLDPEGIEIPIFAARLSVFAVSLSPLKGEYIGRESLARQFAALEKILHGDYSLEDDLPRTIMPLELSDKGIARAGDRVFHNENHVGNVTSGTMVPYWKSGADAVVAGLTDETGKRAIALALLDSDLHEGDEVQIEIRGRSTRATIVPCFLRSEAPPYAHPVIHHRAVDEAEAAPGIEVHRRVGELLDSAIANTVWRQNECINLIPSEMTPSPMVRLLSIMDPAGRYAEHRRIKALDDAEVFFYQGTEFIAEVEELLVDELRSFFGCEQVETRVVSGQMANTTVFSAMVDYLNRADRKSEQRRLRKVLNHHIIKGGHLSAQPMGALRDFVARDPRTEKAAVVNFPVLAENHYEVDTEATREIIARHRPELIILGKSLILHREPVAEVRRMIDELELDCVLMYDMAHVLGLIGPCFQQPFSEGADIITGSTHKTFFGTQRGVIAADYSHEDPRFALWEAVERRTFPGAVSNHHLGTLLGLLMAAYEMNHFKDEYQRKVVVNAKAFARHLKDCGLDVAGDPEISYTETHQVLIRVGYSRGMEIARRLEENNIIVNYQATPDEEGFTAAGALRMGVSEMSRYGMEEQDFAELAQLMHAVIVNRANVKNRITSLRQRFLDMQYCFSEAQFDKHIRRLHELV